MERNGRGPYMFSHPTPVKDKRMNALLDKHEFDSEGRWPTAAWDNIPTYFANGFDSVKALTTWFDGCLGSLVRCGFRIRVFEVPDEYVIMGASGKQLGFEYETIEREIR